MDKSFWASSRAETETRWTTISLSVWPYWNLENYNYIYILLGVSSSNRSCIGLTLVSSSMKNVKQTKSSATMASSIFSSTEKAKTTSSPSSSEHSKTNESSSASIDTPDANHAKEAYTENPRWTNDKASRLASLMVSWGNQMNQPGYKEITNEASSLPIRWMSDHNQNCGCYLCCKW